MLIPALCEMWSAQMKQSGESIYPRYIKFRVELENMKFKNTTLKTKQESLVNVNDLLIKFLNSGSREQQSQHLTGSYRWNKNNKRKKKTKWFYSFIFDKKKIDEKVAIKLIW